MSSPQPALPTRTARELGVSPKELRGRRWRSPYRGVAVPATPAAGFPLQRIYDAAELLPSGAALGGWAAAYLQRATDLDGRGRGWETEPVPIVVPQHLSIRPRPGIVLWRNGLADGT